MRVRVVIEVQKVHAFFAFVRKTNIPLANFRKELE